MQAVADLSGLNVAGLVFIIDVSLNKVIYISTS